MKTTMFLFARRELGYQIVPRGVAVIAGPEDGVYLTVTSESEIPEPDGTYLSAGQLANWLKNLRALGCSMAAIDGYGKPLEINPDGDR